MFQVDEGVINSIARQSASPPPNDITLNDVGLGSHESLKSLMSRPLPICFLNLVFNKSMPHKNPLKKRTIYQKLEHEVMTYLENTNFLGPWAELYLGL